MISDPAGRQLAVRSPNNRVTGWPHSSVKKRIDAGEHEFFATVYESLRRSVEETYADSPGKDESNKSTGKRVADVSETASEKAENDDLADDFSHPIRQVNIFDTVVTLKGGGHT